MVNNETSPKVMTDLDWQHQHLKKELTLLEKYVPTIQFLPRSFCPCWLTFETIHDAVAVCGGKDHNFFNDLSSNSNWNA